MDGGDQPREISALPCSAIVFRAMLRRTSIDAVTKRPLPTAFHRRSYPQDQDGLSVGHSCELTEYLKPFNKHFGAATLHTCSVRDLKLEVTADSEFHANIKGIPYREDDLEQAEVIAAALARHARHVNC